MISENYKGIPDCWDVMGCPEVLRKTCTAYPYQGKSCWMVTGTKCGQGEHFMLDADEKIIYCRNKCKFYEEYVKEYTKDKSP